MIIGSHCSLKAPDYFLGSVNEALSYQANTLMVYTGAPQNARRTALDKLKIDEAKELLNENQIKLNHLVIHAPYLINLANTIKPEVIYNSIELLENEIKRSLALGANILVLHPGSHVGSGASEGIKSIISNLKEILPKYPTMNIALETMAGKGSEVGRTFNELAEIINTLNLKNVKVCLDTCHIHDAGYDLNDFETVLKEFDDLIGLDRLAVIHLNDSKNIRGSQKDRHANLGYGEIGFNTLLNILNHPKLTHLPFILETPYYLEKPPYGIEIEMLKNGKFIDWQKNTLL